MPEYTCPPVAPAGYRLLTDEHMDAVEHALMHNIRHLDKLLAPPVPCGPVWRDLEAQRAAAVAALTAINPRLAAIWTREVR